MKPTKKKNADSEEDEQGATTKKLSEGQALQNSLFQWFEPLLGPSHKTIACRRGPRQDP